MSTDYLTRQRTDRSRYWAADHQVVRRRRTRAAARRSRSLPPSDGAPRLADIADPENMLRVYRELRISGGKAGGIDGIRFEDLSVTEIAAALKVVARAILERRYRPHPTRRVLIAKANGGTRKLRIGLLCDRVVAAAVHQAVSPVIDSVLLPCCYGFRSGRSVLHMLAAMERMMIDQDRYVVATDDIRDAFGSVPIVDAVDDYRGVVEDEGLVWLIEALLRGDDHLSRIVGIDQGSAISPATLNLRLNVCLDRPFTSAGPANPLLLRWVDNLVLPSRSVSEARLGTQRAADLLLPYGFHLKGNEGHPTDLRRQGARRLVLGYLVSVDNGRMVLHVPNSAWEKLRKEFEQAYGAGNPSRTAVQVIRGWTDAYGLAIGGEDVCVTVDRIMGIAASSGFRELGVRTDVEAWIRASQRRWGRIRGTG